MSLDQNVRRSHNMKTDNSSFEMVEVFEYLRTILTNKNYIQEETKSCWKSRIPFYHSMQNLVSSSFLFKIKIYGSIILFVVLYGCEKWSLTLREVRSLRVFLNSLLSIIYRPKKNDLTRLHNLELNDLYFVPNIFGVIKTRRARRAGHVAGMGEENCFFFFFGFGG
jgi:hypothetical protein